MKQFFVDLWTWVRHGPERVGKNFWYPATIVFWLVYSGIIGGDIYGLIDDRYVSNWRRGIAVLYVLAWAYATSVLVQATLDRRARRKAAEPPLMLPLMLVMCPSCGMPQSIFDMDEHIETHLANAHNPNHNGRPVLAMYRDPGEAEWRYIVKEEDA